MKKRKFKPLLITLLCLFLMAAVFISWLYFGHLNETKIKIFSSLPLPVATVNGEVISSQNFVKRLNLANAYYSSNNKPGTANVASQVLQKLIEEKEIYILAKSKEIRISPSELDTSFSEMEQATTTSGQLDLNGILEKYQLSNTDFKQEILLPNLELTKLQTWFNSQTSLNSTAYQQAKNILTEAQASENFDTLAKSYSADTEQSLEGDLGFVSLAELPVELREPLASSSVGSIQILPSRYGLHIIKIEGKENNELHLREIFLNTSSFSNWFNQETKTFNIIKLIKI